MDTKEDAINFNKLGENITALMNHCELDAADLSRETGLPSSTISRLRSNLAGSSPNLSSLIPIASFFQISVSQLIGEEPLPPNICGTFKSAIHLQNIPLFSIEAIPEDLHLTDTSNHPSIAIDFPLNQHAFACHHHGIAMEPSFPDQTLLIIDPEKKAGQFDYVLALLKDKNIPIFRQLVTDGEDRFLKAHNSAFPELIRLTPDNHRIIGVAVESRRKLNEAK